MIENSTSIKRTVLYQGFVLYAKITENTLARILFTNTLCYRIIKAFLVVLTQGVSIKRFTVTMF